MTNTNAAERTAGTLTMQILGLREMHVAALHAAHDAHVELQFVGVDDDVNTERLERLTFTLEGAAKHIGAQLAAMEADYIAEHGTACPVNPGFRMDGTF